MVALLSSKVTRLKNKKLERGKNENYKNRLHAGRGTARHAGATKVKHRSNGNGIYVGVLRWNNHIRKRPQVSGGGRLKNDFKQVRFIYVCRLYAVHLGLCRIVRLAHLADAEPIKTG